MIGIIGLTVILVAGYSEWTSIDLSRHSLGEYVNQQLGIRAWWYTVGIPMLAGAFYVGIAVGGPAIERKIGQGLPIVVACLLLAVTLMLAIGGVGYYATIAMGVVFAVAVVSRFRSRR